MLTQCQLTLAPCSEMLLGIVLALAADQWAQVAQPCRAFLGGNPAASQTASVTAIISKLTLGLNDAARGSEDAFLLHARRLSTAIQVKSLTNNPFYATWIILGQHFWDVLILAIVESLHLQRQPFH